MYKTVKTQYKQVLFWILHAEITTSFPTPDLCEFVIICSE